MKKRIACIISGRVQGVLFRSFTKDSAKELDIKGEVQNLPDGTVKVEAESEEEKLKQFQNKLKKGSAFSKVKNVACVEGGELRNYKDFKIIYGSFFDRF